MKLTIHSGDLDNNGLLTYFATTKLNAVTAAFASIQSVELWLKIEKGESFENKICELNFLHSGKHFFSVNKSRDFEESILLSIDALLTRINVKTIVQEAQKVNQ